MQIKVKDKKGSFTGIKIVFFCLCIRAPPLEMITVIDS